MLQQVPQEHRKAIQEARRRILDRYDDVLALVLIGSVAEGDFTPESDIDLLCVRPERTPWKEQWQLKEHLDPRVWLIFFDEGTFQSNFQKRTTMAHSISRGVILYEVKGYVSGLGKDLALPDQGWMKDWFVHWLRLYLYGMEDVDRSEEEHRKHCSKECHRHISDTLARAAVNLSILFLETQGVVPTTKAQIRRHFEERVDDRRLRAGLELALSVSRQERWMSYEEAQSVAHVATWLQDQLMAALQPTAEDLEEIERLKRII